MGGSSVKENLTGGINEGDFTGKGGVGRIHKKFRVIWSELGDDRKVSGQEVNFSAKGGGKKFDCVSRKCPAVL